MQDGIWTPDLKMDNTKVPGVINYTGTSFEGSVHL